MNAHAQKAWDKLCGEELTWFDNLPNRRAFNIVWHARGEADKAAVADRNTVVKSVPGLSLAASAIAALDEPFKEQRYELR